MKRLRRAGRRHHRRRLGHRPGARRASSPRRGAHLALSDIDEVGLAETVAPLRGRAA